MMDTSELNDRFIYHSPTAEKRKKHDEVRGGCSDLAEELNYLLPDGREKSLAMTNLELVMFWANAAIARNSG